MYPKNIIFFSKDFLKYFLQTQVFGDIQAYLIKKPPQTKLRRFIISALLFRHLPTQFYRVYCAG